MGPNFLVVSEDQERWRSYREGLEVREKARRRLLEARRERARAAALECAKVLVSRFGARCVYIFGSMVKGKLHERSDLDLAVEGVSDGEYLRALSAVTHLAPDGVAVDLVSLETAPPSLRDRVLREGEMLLVAG